MNRSLFSWNRPLSRRLAACVVGLFLGLAAAGGWLAVRHLGFQLDTAALLDPELPFRQARDAYRAAFPMDVSDLLLAVEAPTPEQAHVAASALLLRLKASEALAGARPARGGPYFERNAFLFLETEALSALADRLVRAQPLIGRLAGDPTLRGLFEMLVRMEASERASADPAMVSVARRLEAAINADLEGRAEVISWEQVLRGASKAPARTLLTARTAEPGGLAATDRAERAIEEAWAGLPVAVRAPARLRVSGSAIMSRDELRTLAAESRLGAPLVLMAVTLILGLGLRSIRMALATWASLCVGLLLTAGLAALLIGHLNLISVAFGLLYLGLGVDFAIHWLMHAGRAQARGLPMPRAAALASRVMAGPLGLCALTTSVGFLAFMPTHFVGVTELGLIAAAGMGVSLLLTLTFLPALLVLWPGGRLPAVSAARRRRLSAGFNARVSPSCHARFRTGVRVAALLLALLAAVLVPSVRFDADPVNLRDPETEAVRLLETLGAGEGAGHWSAKVLAAGPSEARRQARRLRAAPAVGRVVSVHELVPEQAAEKTGRVRDLAFMMGAGWSERFAEPAAWDPEVQAAALRSAAGSLASGDTHAAWTSLGRSLTRWLTRLEELSPERRAGRVKALHTQLLGTFPVAMRRLERALAPDPELPASLRRRWVSPAGEHRIEVFPARVPDSRAALERFVEAVQAVAPRATGPAIVRAESGRVIVAAFAEATALALLAITLILLFQLRHLRQTLAVLLPLVLAGGWLVAGMVLLGVPFNFANVIALPLLLGIGVDGGIHRVMRYRRGGRHAGAATVRAILLSGLTTFCAFLVLALSAHPGTASMGLVLSLGLGLILVNTLVLLPALLPPSRGRRAGSGGR